MINLHKDCILLFSLFHFKNFAMVRFIASKESVMFTCPEVIFLGNFTHLSECFDIRMEIYCIFLLLGLRHHALQLAFCQFQ